MIYNLVAWFPWTLKVFHTQTLASQYLTDYWGSVKRVAEFSL